MNKMIQVAKLKLPEAVIEQRKKRLFRLVVVVVATLLAASFLLSTTTVGEVLAEYEDISIRFVASGLGLSFLALMVSGMRLQAALRATGEVLDLKKAVQLVLWNQAAGVLMGGPVAGDMTGASVGARVWGKDSMAYLAAAPLNRGIGILGAAITGTALLVVAGAVSEIQWIELPKMDGRHFPWGKCLLVASLAGAVLWNRRWRGFASGVANRFFSGLAKVSRDPRLMIHVVACGVGVQLLQCGVMMTLLGAVHRGEFSWLAGAWVFVAIGAASMIPSLLGVGPRESAAALFLAPYGVAESEAVAAGLLCGFLGLFWGLVGGMSLLLLKNRRFGAASEQVDGIQERF